MASTGTDGGSLPGGHTFDPKSIQVYVPGRIVSVTLLPVLPEHVSVPPPVPAACCGLITSTMVSAANPMMSYLSIVLFAQIVPWGGASATGAPGPSQLIRKSRVLPSSALSALQTRDPFPTPLMA